jgi:hypothetical protein
MYHKNKFCILVLSRRPGEKILRVALFGSKARWQYMATIQAGLYRNISQDAIPLAGWEP